MNVLPLNFSVILSILFVISYSNYLARIPAIAFNIGDDPGGQVSGLNDVVLLDKLNTAAV